MIKLKQTFGALAMSDIADRAYNQRESRNVAMMKRTDTRGLTTNLLDQERTKQERRKNFEKYVPRLVKTENVVAVRISKTLDTGEIVVHLIDPDGKQTSFWTEGSEIGETLPVRSISNYWQRTEINPLRLSVECDEKQNREDVRIVARRYRPTCFCVSRIDVGL